MLPAPRLRLSALLSAIIICAPSCVGSSESGGPQTKIDFTGQLLEASILTGDLRDVAVRGDTAIILRGTRSIALTLVHIPTLRILDEIKGPNVESPPESLRYQNGVYYVSVEHQYVYGRSWIGKVMALDAKGTLLHQNNRHSRPFTPGPAGIICTQDPDSEGFYVTCDTPSGGGGGLRGRRPSSQLTRVRTERIGEAIVPLPLYRGDSLAVFDNSAGVLVQFDGDEKLASIHPLPDWILKSRLKATTARLGRVGTRMIHSLKGSCDGGLVLNTYDSKVQLMLLERGAEEFEAIALPRHIAQGYRFVVCGDRVVALKTGPKGALSVFRIQANPDEIPSHD